jgi:hypothetical protein
MVTSSEAEWSRRLKRLFGAAALIAAGLVVWGVLGAESEVLALEAAKVGMQLAVVTFLGLALTYVLGRVDEARKDRAREADMEREERRRLNDYRLTIHRDAMCAYTEIKTVRRTLRALGFAPRVSGPSDPEQLEPFNAQMLTLNEAELSLEKVEREIAAQAGVFPKAAQCLDKLETAQGFLREVLDAWETSALRAPEPDDRQRTSLERLDDFLAKRSDHRAEDLLLSIDAFESAIRTDLIAPLPIAPGVSAATPSPQIPDSSRG